MWWIGTGAFALIGVIWTFRMVGMHSLIAKDLAMHGQVSRARAVRLLPVLWLGALALCVGGNLAKSEPTVMTGVGVMVVGVVVQVRGTGPRRRRRAPPRNAPATTADREP